MLTLFTVPKPFDGHVGVIQRNALRSWSLLKPECEIILCGDEPGTAEAASAFHARHIPDVDRNEYGTPLLNSVFERVRLAAAGRLLCYVNADILLLSDVPAVAARVPFEAFLMLGRRWDLDVSEPLELDSPDAQARLRARVMRHGTLHAPTGSDYFVFPKDCGLADLPAFAVGRPAWDNWLIFNARRLGLPVIDAGDAVLVIHQNHDYSHVPHGRNGVWEGPEGDRNLELAGGWKQIYTLEHATHRFTTDGKVLPRA